MMKKQLFILVLFLIGTATYSQVSYKGIVVDEKKEPIPFANIIAYEMSNTDLINAVLTDERGFFDIEVKGELPFLLEVNFLGYKTKTIEVRKNEIGEIVLEEDAGLLEELVIKYKKQTLIRKNDRLVFNIDKTIAQELGSAMDVLKVTPNIIVKGDELTMMGKNSIRVMINGKMLPLSGDALKGYLAGINSSDIIRVEVITVPPSEFEAEGDGGIVNIILKRERKDFWNAIANLSATKNSQLSYGGNLAVNYKKKNTYLTMSVSKGHFSRRNSFKSKIFYADEIWENNLPLNFQENLLSYRFSIAHNVTKKWELGVGYSGSNSDELSKQNSEEKIYDLNDNLKYSMFSEAINKNNYKRHALNFYNIIQLDSLGKKISLDVDYFKNTSFKDAQNKGEKRKLDISQPTISNESSIDYNFENISGQVDVTLPYDIVDVKLGGKISLSKKHNDFKFYNSFSGEPIFDEKQSNLFDYDENIYALYFSGAKMFSDKFSLKAGLRLESTATKSFSKSMEQHNKNNYTKIFPSLYFTYNIEDEKSLSLNISRRVGRPGFKTLDPFKSVLNPYLTLQGNPFLNPFFITKLELIFNYKKMEIKGYGRKATGGIDQIAEIDPTTKMVNYMFYNHIDTETLGLTNTYIFDKFDWLTSYNVADVGYSRISSSIPETIGKQEGFKTFLQTQNQIKLDKNNTFSLGVNYYYVFAAKVGVSKYSGYGALDLSLKANLLDSKWSLIMSANDVFKTTIIGITRYYNNVKTVYDNYFDSRSVKLVLRYEFGNKDIKAKAERSSNKDIQNRAK